MKNPAVKYGLILGVISIFVQWLMYAAGDDVMATWWVGMLWLVAVMVIVIILGQKIRKEKGGYWSFKDAFLTLFIICTISGVMGVINQLLLFGVIDTELPARLKDVVIQKTITMMENMNAPQDKVDEVIEQMQKDDSPYAPSKILKSSMGLFVMGTIFSLIVAAIIKKAPPLMSENGSVDAGTNISAG